MSSASWLFSRADGASSAVASGLPRAHEFQCYWLSNYLQSMAYRKEIESCMMGHGCVIGSSGTFPKRRN